MTRMSGKNLFLLELLGLVILVNLVMPVPLVTCHLADASHTVAHMAHNPVKYESYVRGLRVQRCGDSVMVITDYIRAS